METQNPFLTIQNSISDLQASTHAIEHQIDQIRKAILVKTAKDQDRWISKREAAQLLGVSQSTIDNYRRAGKIQAASVNGVIRFKRSELVEFMERNRL